MTTDNTPFETHFKVIGKPVQRHDAWDKAFGITSYAADFSMPGMLYAKVLRSPHPSARILSIDTSRAEKLPGVKTVLTAKDVPRNESVTRFGQTHTVGGGFEGLYRVLAEKKVHYVGEPIALVAAETEEIAAKALDFIQVKYQTLPGVFDSLEAMKPDAPQVQEGKSNIITHYEVLKGNTDEGFAETNVIVEHSYRVPFVDHAYIEPECGVAWVDENGVITIRVSTQVIEHFRGVAEVLGLPHNQVRVIGTYVGGGFGGKEDITVENFLALLTYKTKRPVKLTYTREESILCHSKRHPYVMEYRTGAKKNGELTALEARIVSDAGAYVYLSPWVLLYSMVNAAGPYRIPHVKVDGYTVMTNSIFSSANRGFGAPQVCFAYESQMDELAQRLGMDPIEIRRMNYLEKGEALATGQVLDHYVALQETTEKAYQALGETPEVESPVKIGRGIASGMTSYGRMMFLHDTARSYVSIEMDGSVTVRTGVQDIGGGQASSLCQIAAETLGVSLGEVKIYIADTALTPLAGTTTATRQLYMSGNATLMAAQEVRKTLLKKAGEMMRLDPERLDLADREAIDAEGSGKFLPLVKVVRACASEGLPLYSVSTFRAPFRNLAHYEKIEGDVFPDFTFGTHAAEVAVDEETGKVEILKLVSCFDVGRSINPLSVEGQLEGGAVYGMGYALTEEFILDRGIPKTPSFSEYLLPTSLDIPELRTIAIESGDGVGPFGAKGVGEPSVCSVAPAICNAVYDAIGVRIYDLPLTPEKIVKALRAKKKEIAHPLPDLPLERGGITRNA
jgi:CO/xanthine dehydrogenase Mo-binding subunit